MITLILMMSSEQEIKLCALCKSANTQEDSHIIPKMVYKWLKKTSPTGHLRGTDQPNLRVQDGPKLKLLCPGCEDRFSTFETEFANKVFHPIHTDGENYHSFEYEEWFHRFAVSVSWRALLYGKLTQESTPFLHGHGSLIDACLESWRSYLNQESSSINGWIQHYVLLDAVKSVNGGEPDFDLNLYIQRGVEFDTIQSEQEAYIFTKLGKVVIAGQILNVDPNARWVNTQINQTRGSFSPGEISVSGCFMAFLNTAVDSMQKARKNVSEKQLSTMLDLFHKKFGNQA